MIVIENLQDKDDKKAYALAQKIIAESETSDAYYCYLDDFLGLLSHKSSFVRARGFTLACAQARWDQENRPHPRSGNRLYQPAGHRAGSVFDHTNYYRQLRNTRKQCAKERQRASCS